MPVIKECNKKITNTSRNYLHLGIYIFFDYQKTLLKSNTPHLSFGIVHVLCSQFKFIVVNILCIDLTYL